MDPDMSETNVIAWILNSVDIIHALFKWGVVIKIEHPATIDTKSSSPVDPKLMEIYNRMENLQAAVLPQCSNASVEIRKMNTTYIVQKGENVMQDHRHDYSETHPNQRSYKALNWIIESLDVLLKVTENGVAPDLQNPASVGLASTKANTCKQLRKIHTHFTSINSKAYSLKGQGRSTNRQLLDEKGLVKKIEEYQAGHLKSERGESQQRRKESEMGATMTVESNEILDLPNEIRTLTAENDALKTSALNSAAHIEQLKQENDKLVQEIKVNKEHLQRYTKQRRDQSENDEHDTMNRQIETLQKKVNSLTEEMKKLAQEKDAIQKRLSEAFSAQLKDNNPAIADLGDAWRPTVIAEKFNQLYDDEWTDGFQVLCESNSETESIQTLFDILKKCYAFCSSQSEVQIKKVTKALVSFESAKPYNQGMQSPKGSPDLDGIPRVTLNQLRRQTCVMSKETVINEFFDQEGDNNTERTLLPFVERCLELSWYMVLQTPPVYVDDCVKFTKRSNFNRDLLKPYTRSGTTIDFVVWPPLYLNKGGPLLAKGVAEPFA